MAETIVITVATKVSDGKGGFKITDTSGGEYILSAKNKDMEGQLQVGRASTVTIFESTYGKFINSAVLFDGGEKQEAAPKPIDICNLLFELPHQKILPFFNGNPFSGLGLITPTTICGTVFFCRLELYR